MIHNEQTIEHARDLVIEHLVAHEGQCSDPNCLERANILAFMAHSIGATDRDLHALPRLLLTYDGNCSGCGSARDSPPPEPNRL